MATIFSSPDIAMLVSAFPPPSASFSRHSLIRSRSGDKLFDSTVILNKLQDYIKTSNERISLSDLYRRLQIDSKSISLADLPDVWYSYDHQNIIPQAERATLTSDLTETIETALVDITSYCAKRNIAHSNIDSIVQEYVEQKTWVRITDGGQSKRMLLCSKSYITTIQARIKEALDEASRKAEMCNLSKEIFNEALQTSSTDTLSLTDGLLATWTHDILKASPTSQGSVVRDGTDVIFIPRTFEEAQLQQQHNSWKARASEVADSIRRNQYAILHPTESTDSALLDEIASQTSDLAIEKIQSTEQVALITDSFTHTILSEAQDQASNIATEIWRERPDVQTTPTLTPEIKNQIAIHLANPEIAQILLSSPQHALTVQSSFDTAISTLEESDRSRFQSLIRTTLTIPTQLYLNSLSTLTDETLKPKLDAFASAHLSTEVFPAALPKATQDRLLIDKTYKKELEKLLSTLPKQSLADTSASVAKCARKLKTDAPSSEAIAEGRIEVLKQKVKAMKKMAKGSDVLQNVIWVLLSQQVKREQGVEALFVSSGKDTSRMIKLYQAGGGEGCADNGARLQRWRDTLKAGGDSEELRQEMVDLAMQTLAS